MTVMLMPATQRQDAKILPDIDILTTVHFSTVIFYLANYDIKNY